MAQTRSEIRNDLIRRLFAVAISVGAAATLARMGWVTDGRWPDLREWQQLSILTAAMTATVLSWDGYLLSIEDRPLNNFGRFAIDVALVFIYMFLLMTSHLKTWWIFIHAIIYTIYILWDLLTVWEFRKNYSPKKTTVGIGHVYIGGLVNREHINRGPVITLTWAIYIWMLFLLNRNGLDQHIFITTLFVLAGLVGYRLDKAYRPVMQYRICAVVLLLAVNAVYLSCFYRITDDYLLGLIRT